MISQPWHSEVSDVARFETDGELRENDWSKGDEDYRGRIAAAASGGSTSANRWAGRSDIFGWIDDVLVPKVEAVNRDFAKRYGWDTLRAGTADERGIKYSPDRRADTPRGGYVGSESGRADSGPGGPVSGQSARKQDGQVSVTGVHFSKEPRTWLSGVYFGKGTGAKSQEAERIRGATQQATNQDPAPAGFFFCGWALWNVSDWTGRLTFPVPTVATTADPLAPAPAESSQAGLKGIGYSSETHQGYAPRGARSSGATHPAL